MSQHVMLIMLKHSYMENAILRLSPIPQNEAATKTRNHRYITSKTNNKSTTDLREKPDKIEALKNQEKKKKGTPSYDTGRAPMPMPERQQNRIGGIFKVEREFDSFR
ncbi:hypothetical protein HA466_0117530 [Hirschfeldia incana]|nr:hypothetical protein HA466_0117530 [Hirschfeldia incana]